MFSPEQLGYMHDIFITPDNFPPEDSEMITGIEAEIEAQQGA